MCFVIPGHSKELCSPLIKVSSSNINGVFIPATMQKFLSLRVLVSLGMEEKKGTATWATAFCYSDLTRGVLTFWVWSFHSPCTIR